MDRSAANRRLVLIEPGDIIRSVVCSVAAELRLAKIVQNGTYSGGRQTLRQQTADGILLSAQDPAAAKAILQAVRAGELLCDPKTPVLLMLPTDSERIRAEFDPLEPTRYIVVPFRVRDIIESIMTVWPNDSSDISTVSKRM